MKELKVTPIKNGTVIDHISSGMALKVLQILKITYEQTSPVTVAMNVASKEGTKDIVKIEDRELEDDELNKIALIAPKATINIIRDYAVERKHVVEVPDQVRSVVTCSNPNCVSIKESRLPSHSIVFSKDPIKVKCFYCERVIEDIAGNIVI